MTTGIQYQGFVEARAIARRRRMRILLPVAVVVILVALVSIAIYDYRSMRADALALSEGVVTNIQSRIETEVDSYLTPIPKVIALARGFVDCNSLAGNSGERIESVA